MKVVRVVEEFQQPPVYPLSVISAEEIELINPNSRLVEISTKLQRLWCISSWQYFHIAGF